MVGVRHGERANQGRERPSVTCMTRDGDAAAAQELGTADGAGYGQRRDGQSDTRRGRFEWMEEQDWGLDGQSHPEVSDLSREIN